MTTAKTKTVTCKDCRKKVELPSYETLHLCTACLEARIKKDALNRKKQQELEDLKAKKDGFTHFCRAAIYPKGGGDDYILAFYSRGEFTKEMAQKKFSRRGQVFDFHARPL